MFKCLIIFQWIQKRKALERQGHPIVQIPIEVAASSSSLQDNNTYEMMNNTRMLTVAEIEAGATINNSHQNDDGASLESNKTKIHPWLSFSFDRAAIMAAMRV